MAIVKMNQFHLMALKSDKDEVLRGLQYFRNVDFYEISDDYENLDSIDINPETDEIDSLITKCQNSIEHINRYYPKKGGISALKEGLPNLTFKELEDRVNNVDFNNINDLIRQNADSIDGVAYDLSKAKEELEELKVFRNFDVVPSMLYKLNNTDTYIGSVMIKGKNEFEELLSNIDTVYFELLGIRKDEAVYMIVCHKSDKAKLDEVIKANGSTKINLNLDITVGEQQKKLEERINILTNRRKELIEQLASLSVYRQDIELSYEYFQNMRVRVEANNKAKFTDKVCVFRGYFPKNQETEFRTLINDITNGAFELEIEDAKLDDEETPVMLKNNKLIGVFEPIAKTYSMPKYNEIDPTPFLAPFYVLFFGMMSADAGYGLVVLLGCIFALKSFNLSVSMRKNVKFFTILSIFTVIWGVAYNSYFGVTLKFMPQLLDISTQVVDILVLAIIFGILHLFFGLALKAYLCFRDGNYLQAIFGVFSWYITLISAGLALLGSTLGLPSIVSEISKWIMFVGFIMIIIGGAIEVKGGFGAKLGAGIYNLYGITSYVGDIVSYSRLLALGLSGAYIALSVNTIASLMFGNIIGILCSVIVLVVFHAFNIFLSYLGAYVHGMRLIYVEFFGKFYEGGGKPFKYFRSDSKYINLDRQFEE